MIDAATDSTSANRLREQLVERLTILGWIRTPEVEGAFRNVPRQVFVPAGTTLEAAYADDVVVTQRGPDGKATSSVSAPWLSLSTPVVLRRSVWSHSSMAVMVRTAW